MIGRIRPLVLALLVSLTACDRPSPPAGDGATDAASTAPPSASEDLGTVLSAGLGSTESDVRAAACAALAAHGDDPRVLPALYLRLADEAEQDAVKLAAVRAMARIGGPQAVKSVYAYFYGRPSHGESWFEAGDWLVGESGAEQIARDLAGMANREDYDKSLVLAFARRHPDEAPLRELAAELDS